MDVQINLGDTTEWKNNQLQPIISAGIRLLAFVISTCRYFTPSQHPGTHLLIFHSTWRVWSTLSMRPQIGHLFGAIGQRYLGHSRTSHMRISSKSTSLSGSTSSPIPPGGSGLVSGCSISSTPSIPIRNTFSNRLISTTCHLFSE